MFLLIIATIVFAWLLYRAIRADPKMTAASAALPGPEPRWIVGNAIDVPLSGAAAPDIHREMFDKYGSGFRLWAANKLLYYTCDCKDIEFILKSTKEIDKGFVYKFFFDWLGDGLIFSTGDKWRARRKALTSCFYFQMLDQFIPVMFGRNGGTLVHLLREQVDEGKIDITPFVGNYTLDVICETSMETFLDAQNDPNSTYVKCCTEMNDILQDRTNKPWLSSQFLYTILGYRAQEWKRIRSLREEYNQILANVRRNGFENEGRAALISKLLRAQAEGNENFRTDEDVREEVETFIFAGHDTTKTAICFALANLARHPEFQEVAYQEIREVLGDREDITQSDLSSLKYLERVIKETMRLYPSVPQIARQLKNDVTLPSSGHTVPAGTMLIMHIYHLHRNPQHFPNPLAFNPDNFLIERIEQRPPFAYIPFSSGPRNCIGQKFAILEMKSALSKLLLNFKFSCDSREPKTIPVSFSNTLLPLHGTYLKVSER